MKNMIISILLIPFIGFAQRGPINVHLKDSSIVTTDYARVSNVGFSGPYVRVDDSKGEKISIKEVAYIEGKDQYGAYRYFKPLTPFGLTGVIWGERTYATDRVELYYTRVSTWSAGVSYNSKYYQYSKDNQPLKKMSMSNLKVDLADNVASMNYLKKAKGTQLTQVALYVVGSVLLVKGFSDMFSAETPPVGATPQVHIAPEVIIGTIALNIPWFLNTEKQKNFIKALKEYN